MHKSNRKQLPFKKHPLTLAVQACCYSMLGALPLANASPTGGQVVGGTGSISQSGTNTTIHQATQAMAINWQSYNVAANERVQYIQPNASSISLNRILSNNGSTIAGRIDANGKVILVNPNGILFTSTASLNVGSLIASGLDINPADFMNGQYLFNEIGGTSGQVVNSGLINASLGGNVALIGKQVRNDGLIQASLGTVTLAAGKQAVLTFDNDGLLGVKVTKEILQTELGVDPAVINSGEIQAQGGRVLLTASQSQDVFSRAVNTGNIEPATSVVVNDDGTFTLGGGADVLNSGTINTSTTSADQNAGRIVLIGENVTSSGTLRADAANGNGGEVELHARDKTLLTQNSLTSARSEADGKGGIVKVLGDKVGLFDQSTVDVSGVNGGGQVLIGGDYQGKNAAIRNASTIVVNRHTSIYADALQNGNGGKVILWSNGDTYFGGNISVRGGAYSGDGGFVETSGKENLLFRGAVDRTAANGENGLLLLDPDDITIVENGNNNDAVADRDVNFGDGGGADYTISASTLQSLLSNGDVSLSASDDIVVDFEITATANSATTPNTLTLEAVDDILFNRPVDLSGINLIATAGFGCTSDCTDHQLRVDATGQSGSITVNGANIDLTSSGHIVLEGNVSITNSGNFTALSTGGYFDNWFDNQTISVGPGNINITSGGTGTFSVGGAPITAGAFLGNITTTGTGSLTVTTTAGQITQSTNSPQNLAIGGNATFNAGTNAINLQNTSNAIAGTITLGPTVGSGGAVTLNNSSPTTLLGAVRATTLTVNASRALTLAANVNTTGVTNLNFGSAVGSTFTTSSGITLATGTLTINGGAGADTFNIGSSISGTVYGNDGGDNFNITASGVSVTNLYGGNLAGDGSGTDTLTGNNQTNDWQINVANSGALNVNTTFSGIEGLIGGTGDDTFTFNTNPSTAGLTINGGTQTLRDTVALGASLSGVTMVAGQYTGIERYQGNANGNTLQGGTANTWIINGTNSGTVGGIDFIDFQALLGGSGVDTFTFVGTGSVAGIPASTTPGIDGGAVGGTNTITGPDGVANAWLITAANAGSLNGNTFARIQSLNGGTGDDTFTFAVNPASTGFTVNGGTQGTAGDAVNFTGPLTTIDVQLTDFTGIEQITGINDGTVGNANISTITGADATNAWDVTGQNSGTYNGGLSFSGFNNLTGGGGDDTFTMGASGAVTGTIDGGGQGSNGDRLVARTGVQNTWNFGAIAGSGSLAQALPLPASTYVSAFVGIENYTGSGSDWANVTGNVNAASYTGFEGIVGSGGILSGTDAGDIWSVRVVNAAGAPTDGTNDGINDGTIQLGTDGSLLSFINFANLNGGLGTDRFYIDNSGSLTGTINGGGGSNEVIGRNSATSWVITGPNAGTLADGVGPVIYARFTNIQSLVGAAFDDSFTFNVNPATAGIAIDGGSHVVRDTVALGTSLTGVTLTVGQFTNVERYAGNANNNSLQGGNGLNTWSITGANSGTVGGIGFVDFQALLGGSGVDNFTVNAGGSIGSINTGDGATNSVLVNAGGTVTGTITGGTGVDTIDVSSTVTAIDAGGGGDFIYVRTGGQIGANVNGGAGGDQFSISGTVNGSLYGDADDDTFIVSSSGSVAGTIYGGGQSMGGVDRVNMYAEAVVNLGSRVDIGATVLDGIEEANATNGVLRARNGFSPTWSITGVDSGIVSDIGNVNLTFTGFGTLVGSNGNNTFNITGNGSISGQITGGAGNDDLNVTLTTTRPAGQVYFIGGDGIDTVDVDGASSTIVYQTGVSYSGNTYDRLSYTGTAGTFNVNYNIGVETVTDQTVANVLAINGTMGNDAIGLDHNGTNATFTVNGSRTVAFSNSNKTNLIVDGGLNFLGQVGASDTINIAGAFSTAGNNVTLRNATTINQTAGTPLVANELMLDRIANPPATLDTAIASLSVTNSGAVSIDQTGNLALNLINTAGPFSVIATGDITDTNTAQRNIGGPLSLTAAGNIILNEANFNYLSGPLTLSGAVVDLNNSVATNFASVTTGNLRVTSAGDIIQMGAILAPVANITALGRNVTLTHTDNDFNNLTITAGTVSLTDLDAGRVGGPPSIASGTITANSIVLTTANGIGSPFGSTGGLPDAPSTAFTTNTTSLTINNNSNGVYVTNHGSATVRITNNGDIGLDNYGSLFVDRLYTNGEGYRDTQGRRAYVAARGGEILAYSGPGAVPPASRPNIVADDLLLRADIGVGRPGEPSLTGTLLSVSVTNRLTNLGARRGFIFYYGGQPPIISGVEDFVSFDALDSLLSLRLIEIESLGEFDPAIFTEVRNYYYEDVAILMPADQRHDATDEDEEKEEKARNSETKPNCEARSNAAGTEGEPSSAECDKQNREKS